MADIPKPISYFSISICKKIPQVRKEATLYNALWILRNPVRLTSQEKEEVLSVVAGER